VVEPVEQYLEFARASDFSHNTVKAYARGLALWWTFLEGSGRPWTDVGLAEFGRFIQDLRHGQIETPVRELHPAEVVADSTIALRVRAVMSFYRYQAASGGPSVAHLYEKIRTSPGSYLPFMEHIARRDGRVRSKVRVRVARTEAPVLSPAQVDALIAGEATWDATNQSWDGDLRYRLLWSLLAEKGCGSVKHWASVPRTCICCPTPARWDVRWTARTFTSIGGSTTSTTRWRSLACHGTCLLQTRSSATAGTTSTSGSFVSPTSTAPTCL
jgi:hypothetical protein